MTKTILSTIMLAALMLSAVTILTTQNAFAENSMGTDEEIVADIGTAVTTLNCQVDTGNIVVLDTYNGATEAQISTVVSDLTAAGFTVRSIDTSVDGVPSCVDQLLIISERNGACLTRPYSGTQIFIINTWVTNGGLLSVEGEWDTCGSGTNALISSFGHTPGVSSQPLQLVSISGNHYDPNVPATMWNGVNSWRLLASHTYDSDPAVVSVDDNRRGTMVAKEFEDGCVVLTGDSNWNNNEFIGLQNNRALASNVHKYLDECTSDPLEGILKEIKEIWMAIQNEIIPLLTNINATTTDTNNEVTNDQWGLREIKREVRIIEDVVTSQTDKVSVTVNLDDKLKTGQVMVLLDTTGTGTLSTVHVAASLPCNITGDGKPTAGPGNDAPGVYVVVGEATGALSNLIWDASTDTGFEGSDNTCVYHASVDAGDVTGGVITDVIIIHPDNHPDADKKDIKKHEKLKGLVTITGTYN